MINHAALYESKADLTAAPYVALPKSESKKNNNARPLGG